MRTRKISRTQLLQQQWRRLTASPLVVWDVGAVSTRVHVGQKLVIDQATCLSINQSSGQIVSYGDAAYRLLGNSGRQLAVQFPVDRGCVSNRSVLTSWLEHLRQELWPRRRWLTGLWATPGVFCLSEGVGEADRVVWQSTLEQAGLSNVKPVVGLLGLSWYVNMANSDEACFVLDLGGSQSQIGVLNHGNILASKTLGWGGVDLTTQIQSWLLQQYHVQVSWRAADQLKCTAASMILERVTNKKTALRGKDPYTQLGVTATVELEELQSFLVTTLQDVVLFIRLFLASIPAAVATSCLENGLWLAGGAAQLDGIERWLSVTLGTPVSRMPDPEVAASRGVAIWAASEAAQRTQR